MFLREEKRTEGDDSMGKSSCGNGNGNGNGNGSKKRKMWIFKRMKTKETWRWKMKFLGSAFKWKRINMQLSFFDDLVFKIVSVLEAIVLGFSLCFFFLCCGCQF